MSLAHEADYHGALAYLNEQLKSYPGEIPMLMRKANLQRRCDMNEEAILTCEQVLKIQPSHQGAAMLRTDVGTKVWSEEKALKEYELMVEQFPHVAKFHYQLLNYVIFCCSGHGVGTISGRARVESSPKKHPIANVRCVDRSTTGGS